MNSKFLLSIFMLTLLSQKVKTDTCLTSTNWISFKSNYSVLYDNLEDELEA
jgi:hypothetical protein